MDDDRRRIWIEVLRHRLVLVITWSATMILITAAFWYFR
jgi:hypothetical protein